MDMMLHALAGEVAGEGKPGPEGAKLAGKAMPQGIPFETFLLLPGGQDGPVDLPVQVSVNQPAVRTHMPTRDIPEGVSVPEVPDLPLVPVIDPDIAAPEAATISPDTSGTTVEAAADGPDAPGTDELVTLSETPVSVPVPVAGAPTDRPVPAPDRPATQVPRPQTARSVPVTGTLPEPARADAPRGLAVAQEQVVQHHAPDPSGARDKVDGPPDHAVARGLSPRPAIPEHASPLPRVDHGVPNHSARTDGTTGTISPETDAATPHIDPAEPRLQSRATSAPQQALPPEAAPAAQAAVSENRGGGRRDDPPRASRAVEVLANVQPRDGTPPAAPPSPTPSFTVANGPADPSARPAGETRELTQPVSPLHGPGAPVEGGAAPSDIPRQRAETAHVRPMFGQIAQAIARNLPDGVVEVRLHPEELGRLRLAITPADAGYSVQVTAERPETLELVRRHIDLLASDMRERGFGSLDFSFGRDGGAAGASFEELADAAPKDETPTGDGLQATLTNRPAAIAPGRVDMRI